MTTTIRTGPAERLDTDRVAPPPAPVESTVAPRPRAKERLLSLDVFRGMTVAGMLLVNQPGSWGAIYSPLEHASWHGWTPTDLIFPFFLFIVGITTHLSRDSRRARGDGEGAIMRQTIRRGAMIFGFGLFMSGFPYYDFTTHHFLYSPFTHKPLWESIRILGVLQRIALAYIFGALLTMRSTLKQQIVVLAALLIGYWWAMMLIPVPGQGEIGALLIDRGPTTLAAWLDRLVLGNHTYSGTKLWDPEGILSTVPAIGTVILGTFAGRWIGVQKPLVDRIAGLFAAGAIGMTAGLMWNWSFPINKNLWTSSYVLFTAGMACVAIAACMWLIDLHHRKRWTGLFVPFGVNPIVAFVGSGLMARLIYSIIKVDYEGKRISLQAATFRSVYVHDWLDPRTSSLLFAISFVLLWYAILSVLHRRNIILKV